MTAAHENPEPVIELAEQLAWGHMAEMDCGELDRQRDSIEVFADSDQSIAVVATRLETVVGGPGSIDQQTKRRPIVPVDDGRE